ncbi:hypothetical protein EV207_1783 [Scopulibacillus darangshiensis]|uniref:Bacterioferritin n=1 Tax=Scopulibacillus darangshiensis TaxID=442528 RepID=A0A4R2N8X7_9BACL|nr:hypothetical protein [Scopulibacillus darangshiensis]TCP17440.1 hypothetical protein EV207_1783 [Scopulibacillus darangshiensis]
MNNTSNSITFVTNTLDYVSEELAEKIARRARRRLDEIVAGRKNFNEFTCSAGLPYPSIRFQKNKKAARILLDVYSGAISEFTALNSFRYQYIVAEPNHPDFTGLLKCVDLNEDFHTRTLAKLIDRLGGNPKYFNSDKMFWNGSEAIYGTNVEDRLKADIAAEMGIIKVYARTLAELNDPDIEPLIRRLALDDVFHLFIFEDALCRFKKGEFC